MKNYRIVGLVFLFVGLSQIESQAQCLEQVLFPPSPSRDEFSESVALDGEMLAVGASEFGPSGGVFLYRDSAHGWELDQVIEPPDDDAGWFGHRVALHGSILAVGDPVHRIEGVQAGVATLYERVGDGWKFTQRLHADSIEERGSFGRSLLFSEDMLFIGDPGLDCVFLFELVDGKWTQVEKLQTLDASPIGYSLAVADGTLLAGAPSRSGGGAAFVFVKREGGWEPSQVLTGFEQSPDGGFGTAVAANDAFLFIAGRDSFEGEWAVYVFERRGSLWWEDQQLIGEGHFGTSLGFDGERLWIGAPSAGLFRRGRVYAYERASTYWTRRTQLTPSSESDDFGCSLALGPERVVVGAPREEVDSSQAGAAYIWHSQVRAAEVESYGDGWPGTHGIPQLEAQTDPILGETTILFVENSSGHATAGYWLFGFEDASIGSTLGGDFLVLPVFVHPVILPAEGMSVEFSLPHSCDFQALSLYLQVLMFDLGATSSYAFTPGLHLRIGNE